MLLTVVNGHRLRPVAAGFSTCAGVRAQPSPPSLGQIAPLQRGGVAAEPRGTEQQAASQHPSARRHFSDRPTAYNNQAGMIIEKKINDREPLPDSLST